ncbi:radical SAM protein [Candidatus Bathyarchaeota archaeon]|nr:radical SAM protein [Candidatus Bathyarchaeota archaeon]
MNHKQTPIRFQKLYTRSNYRIVGRSKHSALKPCHWMVQKLISGTKNCYKGYFGIKSEKCLQCTPTLPFCTHGCVFCWRELEEGNLGARFTVEPDDPGYLVDEFIRNQVNLVQHHFPMEHSLKGLEIMEEAIEVGLKHDGIINVGEFKRSHGHSWKKIERSMVLLRDLGIVDTRDHETYVLTPKNKSVEDPRIILSTCDVSEGKIRQTYKNALNPSHAAISLAGEPMLYPKMQGLLGEFKRRSFTTFIVSNATLPDAIDSLDTLPTQFYFTLPPPSSKLYKRIHRPVIPDSYNAILETLDMVESLSCRTCLRITLVKGLNGLTSPSLISGYANLIKRANPDFVDIKGFAVEARALRIKKRLGMGGTGESIGESSAFAPSFQDVMDFATQLSTAGNFPIVETSRKSRNVLLLANWPRDKSYIIPGT